MPGSDFGDERGRWAAKCRDHRSERRQFTAVEASGKVEQVAHVLAESLNGQNPTGACIQRRSGICYGLSQN
jgi:hypothetical protein